MTQPIRRESPLAQLNMAGRGGAGAAGAAVHIAERPFLGHLDLRGDPRDPAFLGAAKAALGFGLPLEPNTVTERRDMAALWLGPDEWLVLTPPDRETAVARALRNALGDLHTAVTDVSGGQTVINVAGDRARDLLAKGCSLDLHPRSFGPGRCAQTLVAKAGVTIGQVDDSPSFDLIVRRSLAVYLALWLDDAAGEYGPES